jgi:hypothetical protein
MPQEIFYWLIPSFIVAGLWSAGRLVAKINRCRNNRRIQRGIAEYLLQRAAARSWLMKKILIVEDNNDSREILSLFVTKIGYQPIKACNSKEAITYADTEEPDLIFMDIGLPDADGTKTTAILKQNPKTLSYSCRCAYGMGVGTMGGKSCESGYGRLLTKTGLTSDVKGNHRKIHQRIAHPRQGYDAAVSTVR